MSGDLGNLLTGEMGEAEARFAHEDFAGACGRRVAQRVRRRRTVRAAGVGGGSMLTAGALAVGASNVPWGAWGTAAGVAPGATDCVTPSPSAFAYTDTATNQPSEPTRAADGGVTWTDTAGREVTVNQDASGTWWVTRGTDDPEPVLPDENGVLTVVSDDGERIAGVTVVDVLVGEEDATWIRYTVDGEGGTQADDCYTPSPTPSVPAIASASAEPSPSPSPSLATKPEDVVGDSPFECGFEFPTESYGSETQSIDGVEWVSPDEINAQIKSMHPEAGSDIYQAMGQDDVPVVNVNDSFGSSFGEWVSGGRDAVDPMLTLGERDPDALPSGVKTAHGSSFVAVARGVVIGTIVEPFAPAAASPLYQRILGDGLDESLVLLNPDIAFTACPGATLDGDWDLFAIAGDVARESNGTVHGPDYFWLKVGTP